MTHAVMASRLRELHSLLRREHRSDLLQHLHANGDGLAEELLHLGGLGLDGGGIPTTLRASFRKSACAVCSAFHAASARRDVLVCSLDGGGWSSDSPRRCWSAPCRAPCHGAVAPSYLARSAHRAGKEPHERGATTERLNIDDPPARSTARVGRYLHRRGRGASPRGIEERGTGAGVGARPPGPRRLMVASASRMAEPEVAAITAAANTLAAGSPATSARAHRLGHDHAATVKTRLEDHGTGARSRSRGSGGAR